MRPLKKGLNLKYFAAMTEVPGMEHRNCMVYVLGHAGLLEEAKNLTENAEMTHLFGRFFRCLYSQFTLCHYRALCNIIMNHIWNIILPRLKKLKNPNNSLQIPLFFETTACSLGLKFSQKE